MTIRGYDFGAWLAALVDLDSYGLTVVHDLDPATALRRLGADTVEPGTGHVRAAAAGR